MRQRLRLGEEWRSGPDVHRGQRRDAAQPNPPDRSRHRARAGASLCGPLDHPGQRLPAGLLPTHRALAVSVRDLTLAAIGGLTALGGSDTNLMLQVSIALSLDISREEIIGVIEHAATYAGFPRAQAALQAVRGVLET